MSSSVHLAHGSPSYNLSTHASSQKSEHKPSLLTIPRDPCLVVAEFLQVVDILRVFKSCKELHHNKNFYTDAFKEFYAEYRIESGIRGFLDVTDMLRLTRCWKSIDKHFYTSTVRKFYVDSHVTEEQLKLLPNLFPMLTDLDLEFCEFVTDKALEHLRRLPLRKLNLNSSYDITSTGLKHFAKTPLRNLYMSQCEQLTTKELSHLPNTLEVLDISECGLITNAGLEIIARIALRDLNIKDCINITDEGLRFINGSRLENLNLSGCNITNKGLVYLSQNSAKKPLKKLDLTLCEKITDQGLASLASFSLEDLWLKDCMHITDMGLAHLTKTPLKSLNLNGLVTVC